MCFLLHFVLFCDSNNDFSCRRLHVSLTAIGQLHGVLEGNRSEGKSK